MMDQETTVAEAEERLEDVIAIAQRLVRAEKDKSKVTPTFIADKVKRAAETVVPEAPESVDQKRAIATLIQRFSHWIGKTSTLRDNTGHIEWLTASRKKDWLYWRRYRDFLEAKLSEPVVDGLDEATDDILSMLEDPVRSDPWDRRGLVVGHVQSGKTSNYSGLICKAADAGYKIIIVLAGLHNNLRSQTQMRLEEAFLGYQTTADRGAGLPIGVAEFGEDLKTNSATTREDNGDFNRKIAQHFGGISPEERPWLFVVKKQKTVLQELLGWIRTRVADSTDAESARRVVTKLPLLMIDDEADHASVDTGEQPFNEDGTPNEEHKPKTINSLIRQILHSFSRKAYVGYTATPFANIFIHHKGATTKEGPDLFPRSFIINLAAPSNYVGPARIFGRLTKQGREGGLPLNKPITDQFDPESGAGWMPPKHKRDHVPTHEGQEIIPPSLREALMSFALACAVRVLRGQGNEHCSMLVHVTRFVDVQKHVQRQVEEAVRQMRQRILRGFERESLLDDMRALWDRDFVPTNVAVAQALPDERLQVLPAWEEVVDALGEVLEDLSRNVRSINGTAKDALDYANRGTPLKVIAIGGDKLARGLTLEGLCTSYFVRTTKMYDTLMQMGRWFGYRPGYLDLCRLYTSEDLIEWFGHIADASEELREEFDIMAAARLTPEAYGLKVMSHEVLTVTSPLKMRNAKTLSLTFSGTRPQTILFYRDRNVQSANLAAVDALVSELPAPVTGVEWARDGEADRWPKSKLWKDVGSDTILRFLAAYATHKNATSAKSGVLADFITKMNGIGQLRRWNVALVLEGEGKGERHVFSNGLAIDSYPMRTPRDPEEGSEKPRDASNFAIGVLTDPADESIDLPDEAWRKALEMTIAARQPDPGRGPRDPKPSGKQMRAVRSLLGGDLDRGLLLLYPLSPYSGKKSDRLTVDGWEKPIMAMAIAFPSSESGIRVEYEVNLLYWEQEYGPSE